MNDGLPADAQMSARLIQQTREQIATLEGLIDSAKRMIHTSRTLLKELKSVIEAPARDSQCQRLDGRLA